MREVSEDASQISGGILRTFLHRERAIPFMSDNVVRRLVKRAFK